MAKDLENDSYAYVCRYATNKGGVSSALPERYFLNMHVSSTYINDQTKF